MVTNISYRTRKEDLHKSFDKYGEIADVYIPKDTHGESRGFGFVRYYDRRDAEDALVMDGNVIDGRRVGVQMAKYGPRHGYQRARHRYRSRSRSSSRHVKKRSPSKSWSRSRSRGGKRSRRTYRSASNSYSSRSVSRHGRNHKSHSRSRSRTSRASHGNGVRNEKRLDKKEKREETIPEPTVDKQKNNANETHTAEVTTV